jgi:hypothetical protein
MIITYKDFKKLEDKVEEMMKQIALIIKEKELKKDPINELAIPTFIDFQDNNHFKIEIGRDQARNIISNDIYIQEIKHNDKKGDCILFPKGSIDLIIDTLKKYA